MPSAVEIHTDFSGLTRTDIADFRLSQVGLDPEVIERHNRHEIRTGFDPIADLRLALSDISGHRRTNQLPGIFQMCIDEFMFRQFDGRVFHDRRAADLSVERVVFGLSFPDVSLPGVELIRCVLQNLL